MEERRLRLSRRVCRLPDRLVKQPVSSDAMRLLLRNLQQSHSISREQREAASGSGPWRRRRHLQVLEGQRGEGVGSDVHHVVVAEVERFQSVEGPELLRRDAADPVVGSETTNSRVPQLA